MRSSIRVRRTLAALAAAALVITGTVSTASAANAAIAPASVTKMAALGDSITLGLMSCSRFSGCPANSWSTGTSTSVPSHLRMIDAGNGAAKAPVGLNYAVSGSLSSGLLAQAKKTIGQGVNYVTIEIGANDACTRTTGAMTPVATYRLNVIQALDVLKNQAGNPKVFIASVPNLKTMWDVSNEKSGARLTWGLLKICQSMLVNPTSMSAADQARRDLVLAQVQAYNAQLASICAMKNPDNTPVYNCQYDNGAVFNAPFNASHISTRDYFHPSIAGQTLLAQTTWNALQSSP